MYPVSQTNLRAYNHARTQAHVQSRCARPRARAPWCARSELRNSWGGMPCGSSGRAGAECRHRDAHTYPVSRTNVSACNHARAHKHAYTRTGLLCGTNRPRAAGRVRAASWERLGRITPRCTGNGRR
eukprot:scaffold723_cov363-Prasinococcus_capsulatus_cf.AAC.15